jgi:multifunctional methyltransferase subunit TRM112
MDTLRPGHPPSADFIKKMMARIDYSALKQGAEQMGVEGLPDAWEEGFWEDADMVQRLHHALLEVHLEEGALICPESGRRFPVQQGVPNMLLHEDEV